MASGTPEESTAQSKGTGSVTTMGATAIGVGGMMGAGLYTLLGLAASIAGAWYRWRLLSVARLQHSPSTPTRNSAQYSPVGAGLESS